MTGTSSPSMMDHTPYLSVFSAALIKLELVITST